MSEHPTVTLNWQMKSVADFVILPVCPSYWEIRQTLVKMITHCLLMDHKCYSSSQH